MSSKLVDLRPTQTFGTPIPVNDPHAISVEYPKWSQVLALSQDDKELASSYAIGYPRFKIHPLILELENKFNEAQPDGFVCILFPSPKVAERCQQYITQHSEVTQFRTETVSTRLPTQFAIAHVTVLFFPPEGLETARHFWASFGEGISSRFAEYFLNFGFDITETKGRPMNPQFDKDAKKELTERIADLSGVKQPDVYLYPTGMAAVFHCLLLFQELTYAIKQDFPVVLFGFAFKDTPKVLDRWGPGVKWYPKGTEEELDELAEYLKTHRISGLITEVPSNPLLGTPNLKRIQALAQKYNFLVCIDDTLGNMINVDVLPYADVTVTSLTKIFSGACNVMGGCLSISPHTTHHKLIKPALEALYEDNLWSEDAVILEANSRNVVERAQLANANTERVVNFLQQSEIVEKIYYPSLVASKENYELVKRQGGGYGSLVTILFTKNEMSEKFYDAFDVYKGPSLGVDATISIPYAYGAHGKELDFIENVGVSRYIVRISVGLEPVEKLLEIINNALTASQ